MRFRHAHEPGDMRLGYAERKAERRERVKETSKRFSVVGRSKGAVSAGDAEKGVEMREISPSATNGNANGGARSSPAAVDGGAENSSPVAVQNAGTAGGRDGARSALSGRGIQPPAKKAGPGGPGGLMDRTPR
jgi:hypothetical protein